MARRHDDMVDVELDDEPEPSARPARGSGSASTAHAHIAPATPEGRRRRRARLLRAAAVGMTGAALVIATLTLRDAARVSADDARVAAASGTPGLVPSLRSPLQEQWRGPGSLEVVGEVALAAEETEGRVRTVARDAQTGTRLWLMPRSLTPGNLTPLCRPLGGDGGDLACEVPGRPGVEAPNTDEALGATPGSLVVLDVRGTPTAIAVLPIGTVGWDTSDGDLVTARLVDGSLVVERVDPAGLTVLWSASAPVADDVLARQLRLRVASGLVLVDGAAAAVLDVADGSVLVAEQTAEGGVLLSTDRLGFTLWHGTAGTWHDLAGRAGARLDGEPVELAVDDGSGGALALVRSGRSVVGVDLIDVALSWNRGPVDRALLRLDGLLLLDEGGRLRAVDADTGEHLWSVPASLGADGTVVASDGVRVLAVLPGAGTTGQRLGAVSLADGSIVWSVPMPAGTTAVSAAGGTVVALGDD
uniref:hypothetical protein n=1 Tax=Actinotalea sp. TaxID=1872145 RepID=UPI0035687EF3